MFLGVYHLCFDVINAINGGKKKSTMHPGPPPIDKAGKILGRKMAAITGIEFETNNTIILFLIVSKVAPMYTRLQSIMDRLNHQKITIYHLLNFPQTLSNPINL